MNEVRKNPRHPVLLVILDGYGVNPSRANNGVAEANTPCLDKYFSQNPHTILQASGKAVGLPDGQMGNSEVGHMALGCGSVVHQDIVNIDNMVSTGEFYDNEALCAAIDTARSVGRPAHIIGLISDGGVHSHISHTHALIELCSRRGVRPALHIITDGRDTSPKSIIKYIQDLEAALSRADGYVATVSGRYYSMDRDSRWDRTRLAWMAMVRREGRQARSLHDAIEQAYANGETDEFILPTVITGTEAITVQDSPIFSNYRKDRARQLVKALFQKEFTKFDRGDYLPVTVTCMTEYDKWYKLPYAFEQDRPKITLGEIISQTGLKQFHCAETEKYPHVTYFFNGGRGDAYQGETRVTIDSPKVATYDLAPEMSAAAVADTVIDAVKSKQYAFIVVNFANGDMVGHTAIREAVIKSVEAMDKEVGRLLDVAVESGFSVVLTADHGNCEEMVDPVTGEPHTQHTVYPVPCMVIDEIPWQLSIGAGISSVAPTVLQLMGLQKSHLMDDQSLLLKPLSETH